MSRFELAGWLMIAVAFGQAFRGFLGHQTYRLNASILIHQHWNGK